jgi:hypothetical protein
MRAIRSGVRGGVERRRVGLCAASGIAIWLAGGWASAQTNCEPATTPCQVCPPPPACTPSATLCSDLGSGGSTNTSTTASSLICTGAFDQTTVVVEENIGPTQICVGPDRSIGCTVPAGNNNFNLTTHSIVAGSPVAVPTLSLWALGALVAGLGGSALRRLAGG